MIEIKKIMNFLVMSFLQSIPLLNFSKYGTSITKKAACNKSIDTNKIMMHQVITTLI